ncbi:MAG: DeoR/GlpR family DNA-binding transcription regulator, partial [Syntrophothermus sp.]
MLSAERRTKILELIRTQGNVEVKRLASELAVSLMTVRRDLEALEEKGLVVWTHGGAVLPGLENTEVPYHTKRFSHAEEKRRIARKALEMIDDGDTLILDSGSTTLEIARLIRWKKGLTVITTDLKIALELGNQPGIRVFCTGG